MWTARLTPPAPEDVTPFASLKRFRERWNADADFRASLPSDPPRIASLFGITVDPEEVRPFWDPRTRERIQRGEAQYASVVKRFLDFTDQLGRHRNDVVRSIQPAD